MGATDTSPPHAGKVVTLSFVRRRACTQYYDVMRRPSRAVSTERTCDSTACPQVPHVARCGHVCAAQGQEAVPDRRHVQYARAEPSPWCGRASSQKIYGLIKKNAARRQRQGGQHGCAGVAARKAARAGVEATRRATRHRWNGCGVRTARVPPHSTMIMALNLDRNISYTVFATTSWSVCWTPSTMLGSQCGPRAHTSRNRSAVV
jgi:hypothetical protein